MTPVRSVVTCHITNMCSCFSVCRSASLSVCLPVPNEGEVRVENNSAGISMPAPSHNATALKGDVQRDEVFSAIQLLRFFRIKSRNASIIIVMLVRPSFRMYQLSSHWEDFR